MNTGLALARQIAMVSYRSHAAYQTKFGRRRVEKNGKEVDENEASTLDAKFAVRNYLEYQGKEKSKRESSEQM